jgi:hypothetical protein
MALPDDWSLTRIRTRYGVERFRRFFDAILEQWRRAELAWDKELSFDSTQVRANAAISSLTPRFARAIAGAFAPVAPGMCRVFATYSQQTSPTDRHATIHCACRRGLHPS